MTGPEYVFVYVVLCAGLTGLLWLLRRRAEDGPIAEVDTSDAYRLALLRGGGGEAARLAVVRLIDGGWLAAVDDEVALATSPPPDLPPHPLERAVLGAMSARGRATVAQLGNDTMVAAWVGDAREALEREGLLAGAGARWLRVALAAVGALIAIAVAGERLDHAAARGRHNTGILETLRVLVPVGMAVVLIRGRRTRRGDKVLADLRTLVSGVALPEQPRDGVPLISQEVLLAAAVMGIAALPSDAFAYTRVLFPQARGDGSGGGCGSASTCGSGGGGGGGDGGGGCGGGCGGCGGGCGG